MDRRAVVKTLSAAIVLSGAPAAKAQTPTVDALLAQLDADPSLVENAWPYREHQVQRGVGAGTPSSRRISPRAIDIITRLEVSSQARYERFYTHPIWPRGLSGVTIGIGYDLRFATESNLRRDWGALLPEAMITALIPVLQLGGEDAQGTLPSVQSVEVPWNAATQQFAAFLPYPTGDAESVFPNSDKLSDDSFGALVSLVFNRGKSIQAGSNRRREMRNIHDLMLAENFAAVPAEIRAMQRLWPNADQRGIVLRREIEAALFEAGMAQTPS